MDGRVDGQMVGQMGYWVCKWVEWMAGHKSSGKTSFLLSPQLPHFTLWTDSSSSHLEDQGPLPAPTATIDGSYLPEKPHLLVLLLIFADYLGGGDAHLYAVHYKFPCPLQGFVVQP